MRSQQGNVNLHFQTTNIMKTRLTFGIKIFKGLLSLCISLFVLLWNSIVSIIELIDGGDDQEDGEPVMFSYSDDDRRLTGGSVNAPDETYEPGQSQPLHKNY